MLAAAARPNDRWSMDFVSDVTWSGRRFRIFAVVDDFTRETLALVVDTSLGGARVARVLDELVALRGAPVMIVCDNGPEFTSKALDAWAYQRGVKLPLHPTRQARRECLRRELQRQAAQRVPQRELVPQSRRHEANHRGVASRLQRGPSA